VVLPKGTEMVNSGDLRGTDAVCAPGVEIARTETITRTTEVNLCLFIRLVA